MYNLVIKKITQHIQLNELYSFLFGMLGAMFILLISHFIAEKPQKIATIDINFIVREFAKNEAKKNLPPEKLEYETKLFGHNLENSIKQFAKQNHLVLIPREAVYAGTTDYTQLFLAKNENNNLSE